MSSRLIMILMPIHRKKATTGLRSLVKIRGAGASLNGKEVNSNILPFHMNLRYLQPDICTGTVSFRSRLTMTEYILQTLVLEVGSLHIRIQYPQILLSWHHKHCAVKPQGLVGAPLNSMFLQQTKDLLIQCFCLFPSQFFRGEI